MKLPKELNLTKNQERLYLEYLNSGEDTAASMARKVGIDKTTAYRAVENLVERGLLVKNPRKRGTTYTATNPRVLNEMMQDRIFEFEAKAAKLEKIVENLIEKSRSTEKTYILVEKGVHAHYKMMQRQLDAKEKIIRQKINTNAPLYDFKNYPGSKSYKEFITEFVQKRKEKGIFLRQLLHANIRTDLQSIHETSERLHKEVRITPTEIMQNISFKVFDNLFIITIHKEKVEELTIITIHDPLVAELVKSLFDFIYTRSIIYHGEQKKLPTKTFGGTAVPVLGIGTWGIGGHKNANPYRDDLHETEQIKHSISLGQTYIDICHTYAEGNSVETIASAIRNFPRKHLFINAKLTFNKDWSLPKSPRIIEKQLDQYLKKLNTEYVDSFMIHNPKIQWEIGIENVAHELEALRKKGKLRNIAVSNFTVTQLQELQPHLSTPIAANELHYNVATRVIEDLGIYEFCQENNIAIVAWRPLKLGFFNTLEGDNLITRLAEKYNKTPNQIALNWLTNKQNVIAIPKSTNGSHINENIAAVGWKMSKEDYRKLDAWRLPGYVVPKNFDPEYERTKDRVGWTGL